jgi:hypothetical protein
MEFRRRLMPETPFLPRFKEKSPRSRVAHQRIVALNHYAAAINHGAVHQVKKITLCKIWTIQKLISFVDFLQRPSLLLLFSASGGADKQAIIGILSCSVQKIFPVMEIG